MCFFVFSCNQIQPRDIILTTHEEDVVADYVTQTSSRIIPLTHNGYVCYCHMEIPSNCLSGGCFTTPDHVGYCNFGIIELNTCLPPLLNPTEFDLEKDCNERVQETIVQALRIIYRGCNLSVSPYLSSCEILHGCSAIKTDGTLNTFNNSTCDQSCPRIPLVAISGNRYNFNLSGNNTDGSQATFVPSNIQMNCEEKEEINSDTQSVCMWINLP